MMFFDESNWTVLVMFFYYLKDMDFYWIKRYCVCYLNYVLLGPIVSRFFLEACTYGSCDDLQSFAYTIMTIGRQFL